MTHPLFATLDFSQKRKVFAVGDIHGEFTKLDAALTEVGFDPAVDAVISLGDLCDRGPESERFEEYIHQPWFYRVRGNHDDQPREYLLGYESAENVSRNGGDWFLTKSPEEQERIASLLEDAPLALQVVTPAGYTIGITHADMDDRWDHLEDKCKDPGQERMLVNRLTASRKVITRVQTEPSLYSGEVRVHGIDHVFHGHTPLDESITVANRSWIDTGACYPDGLLTVIDVDAWVSSFQ